MIDNETVEKLETEKMELFDEVIRQKKRAIKAELELEETKKQLEHLKEELVQANKFIKRLQEGYPPPRQGEAL
jgi:hypothetical protein